MNDMPDPFAERPYVPPTAQGTDESGTSDSSTPSEEPITDEIPAAQDEPPVAEAPAAEPPQAEPASAEAPAAEPSRDVPVAAETPAAAADPDPAAEEWRPIRNETVGGDTPPVAEPADQPVDEPAAYTHRYSAEPALATAAATEAPGPTPTTTMPLADFGDNDPFPPATKTGDEPPKRRGRKLVGVVAIAALAGAAGFGGAAGYDRLNDDGSGGPTVSSLDTGNTTSTNAPAGAVEKVAAKVLPSVVQINVKGKSDSGSGTGIIISSDGEILTNNHVVEVAGDDGTLTVAFSDGTNVKATIVGTDPLTDLAVIKATDKSGLVPATLGSSADLKVGQEVVAIGSPFGLESTVTSGIISALNRPVTSSSATANDQGTTFPAVQTDAAINPGNSGGPLVDLNGNVVAINSAIRSGASAGEAGSIGLGFAIPIDLAKNVSKQLLAGKKVEHARIGVEVGQAVSSDDITGIGALVSKVTAGGAGDKAGLKKGDIITAVNGHPVASNEALVASVRGYQPGEKIKITYQRSSKTTTVEVTLDSDGGNLK